MNSPYASQTPHPSTALSEFVELFTYYEDYAPSHSIERVLPEGVVKIIIDLTEDPKWMFNNDGKKLLSCSRDTTIRVLELSSGSEIVVFDASELKR